MKLFTPLRPEPTAVLPAANPTAKLAAAALLMAVLFVSVDALTALIILIGLAASLPFSGLRPVNLAARIWPIPVAALSVGILNVVFAAPQGAEVLHIGPLTVSSENVASGIGLGLRLMAIASCGVLATVTTDPTALADSLVQQLRLSPRFAVGALAAARLLPIMATEWQVLSLARRARGVTAGRSPIAAIGLFFGKLLAMLVGAVRRGTRLAVAMESRGFGSLPCRSVARPQRVERRDWMLIGAAAALGLGAVGVSLVLGSWRFLFS
jgi:energy-coupling factor transport system permease protein